MQKQKRCILQIRKFATKLEDAPIKTKILQIYKQVHPDFFVDFPKEQVWHDVIFIFFKENQSTFVAIDAKFF